MKRGNSQGPGVSQFSVLQAGLDHGVEQLGQGGVVQQRTPRGFGAGITPLRYY